MKLYKHYQNKTAKNKVADSSNREILAEEPLNSANMSEMDGAAGGNRSAVAPGRGSLSTTTSNVFAGSTAATTTAGAVGGAAQTSTAPLLNFNLDSLIDDAAAGGPGAVANAGAAAIAAAAAAAGRSARFMMEGVGARVIRGPDWKWGKQVGSNFRLIICMKRIFVLVYD